MYIYLLRYAEHEPDLALLSINTFQKDLADLEPAHPRNGAACAQRDQGAHDWEHRSARDTQVRGGPKPLRAQGCCARRAQVLPVSASPRPPPRVAPTATLIARLLPLRDVDWTRHTYRRSSRLSARSYCGTAPRCRWAASRSRSKRSALPAWTSFTRTTGDCAVSWWILMSGAKSS